MQDHELKQTQQQLTKAVTQNELLKKKLNSFSKLKKQQEEIYNTWCRQDAGLREYLYKKLLRMHRNQNKSICR